MAGSLGKRLRRLLPSRQALLMIGLLNAFILILGGLALVDSYHQARDRATQSAEDLSMTLSEGVGGLFDRIDFALLGISDFLGQNAGQNRAAPEELHALLSGWRRRVPEIEDFWVVGSDGQIRHSGRPIPAQAETDVTDRDYFIQLRDGGSGLVITRPVVGRVTQQWVLILARRVSTADGAFAGVVMATLPIGNVAAMFSSLHLGRDGAVALRAAGDLSVMTRYPETVGNSAAVGKTAVSKELQEAVQNNPRAGNYFAKAGIDGIERSLSYHKIGDRAVYVVVGLATSDVMAAWRRGAMPLIAGMAAFLLLTLSGGAVISRIWKQRMEAHESLRQMLADKERFSEILAHHLQEPVRIQYIFAQQLKTLLPAPLPHEAAVSLDHVLRGASRLRALLRDVRTYLTLDDMLNGAVQSCDAEAVLSQILQHLDGKIREAGAQMAIGEMPVVPLNDKPFSLMMLALLDNSLEYRSPDRMLVIRIEGGRDKTGWVWFSVIDNGIGIPEAYRDRVFNVFERLHPQTSQNGTGIGLAMVRKIVQRLGGHAEIGDGDDGGARVTVYLPDTASS